jgi:hypothetical protein
MDDETNWNGYFNVTEQSHDFCKKKLKFRKLKEIKKKGRGT